MSGAAIDRSFTRISAGLVHSRSAGKPAPNGPLPLYMAHAGPGSSQGLVPLISQLGKSRQVIAPDMLGNGDSEAPAVAKTDVGFYVDCAVQLLDKLGIERVDFYGQHTGANIGCELALRHPDRVGRLILDGVALFPPDLKAKMIESYAPEVRPDDYGGHLLWAWNFVRDLSVHFPYFMRDPAHRLHKNEVPSPAILQQLTVELLKALPTYHLAYQAIFVHPLAERLALLAHPTLIMVVDSDPLAIYHDQASALVPNAINRRIQRDQRASAIEDFLTA